MRRETDTRPDPEALLDEARKSGRGRLKIFLGAAPGVGKTFAMLEEARAKTKSGVKVVVALVETHGRQETAALVSDLEQVPRRAVPYRGQTLGELDVDAVLARRPELVLIDEFAHANAGGSRHPKRWQDVMEVLDAGIDVTTTLNIQHIESLNDVVARITGVRVRETVPDEVLARANEIELIDLPPDELLARLRDGKVYVPDQIGRALDNFFSKGNLTALRELALRTAASHVDADMIAWMQSHAIQGPWPTQERLLVCINEAPVAKSLVRTARRMADRAKIPWIAATVVTPRHDSLGEERTEATRAAMRLAQTLGGETVTLHAESDAAGELLAYARKRNVTRLVIGRPTRRILPNPFRENVSDRLLDAPDFEITVVGAHPRPKRPKMTGLMTYQADWMRLPKVLLEAVGTAALATAVSWPFWSFVPVASIAIPYLIGALVVSFRHGLIGAAAAATTGFLAYNFFFTTPYYSFAVEQHESIVALIVFAVSALFTGTLASRLRAQVESMRAAQRRTETLYDFGRKIASATKADDVLWAAAAHIAATLDCASLILMPDEARRLVQVQGHPTIEEDLDPRAAAAALWAFERNEPAGAGTGTLPTTEWLFLPLATSTAPLGVLGVRFRDLKRASDPELRPLLLAVEDQVAVAVERLMLASELEGAKVREEGEKLRSALLNSVSHDLRTPLVSVIGGLSAVRDAGDSLAPATRGELIGAALDEARRLDRYVQNLLDMTKIGHGALPLRRAATDLAEIIGRVREDLSRALARHPLKIDVPTNLPPVDIDPVLIGQALINVLDNAAKFSPVGEPIAIAAALAGGAVELRVTDRGPGIPPEERQSVFDLFHRVARQDGQPAGTGLGLAIVKGFVEAHGGSVAARIGDDGDGTTIVIRLPVATPLIVPEEAL